MSQSNVKFSGNFLERSIINQGSASTDTYKPYTYADWLQNSSTLSVDYNQYKKYLSNWSNIKQTDRQSLSSKDKYIIYLKQLAYNHLFTADEIRLLNTADISNRYEAEPLAAIYSRRLKQIIEYIQDQREEVKFNTSRMQDTATPGGVANIIHNDILRKLRDTDFRSKYRDVLGDLDRLFDELRVEIVELYDTESGYTSTNQFDPESQYYDLAETYNKLTYDPYIFLSPTVAIANIVNKYNLASTLSIDESVLTITFDSNQVYLADFLPVAEFEDYTVDVDKLNITSLQNLVKKTVGADTYYIKTNDTGAVESTGLLFESENVTGNIYNKQQPHVNFVSNKDTKTRTIFEIGGYFTPQHLGVLTYTSVEPKIQIDESKLQPDTIYTYPDATKTGDSPRASAVPVNYVENVEWMKFKTNDNLVADVLDQSNYQKFYNYISSDEYNKFSKVGITRKDDTFDFWSGDKSDIWSNVDVFETRDEISTLPIEDRQDSQMINQGQTYKWYTDIYGNEYALLKPLLSYDEYEATTPECDKDKYQNNILCRIFDGGNTIDNLKGIMSYEICVDGGSNNNVQDISRNLAKLSDNDMLCNNGLCPVGSRWLHEDKPINGFNTPPKYSDLANALFILPDICEEINDQAEETASTSGVFYCDVIDGYAIKVPEGYNDMDYYELIGSSYGYNEPSLFSTQYGQVYNPPFDGMWDGGGFDTICVDVPQDTFYDLKSTIKYNTDEIYTVPTTFTTLSTNDPVTDQVSRREAFGKLIVRNNNSEYIDPYEKAIPDIISCLPEEYEMLASNDNGATEYVKKYYPREELVNNLQDVDIINDIILLKTPNFIFVLKIIYDYSTDSIQIDNTHTLLLGMDYRSVYVKPFYCEKEDTLIVGRYQLPVFDSDSPGNLPTFTPIEIYTINVSSSKLVFSKIQFPTSGYLLDSSIGFFSPGDMHVSYNEQLKLYYITCVGSLTDNVYGTRFFTYQNRFTPTSKNSSTLLSFNQTLYYTKALDYNRTEDLKEIYGVETLETDDLGFNYYNLSDLLTDDIKTTAISYNDINNRLLTANTNDLATGDPGNVTRPGDFTALFVPEAVSTFFFRLKIDTNNILPNTSSPVYRVEARFSRPDISDTHIDRVFIDRKPLPDYSTLDISRIPNGNDLADPRQTLLTYEYNFKQSPEKCIAGSQDCLIEWDYGQRHPGQLFKFCIIAHTLDGQKHIYPFKYILRPFDIGTSLTGVDLIDISSYVDKDYNECTLLVLEAIRPKMTTSVVLRSRSLIKEKYNNEELLTFDTNIIPNTTNSLSQETFLSQF